jgi:Carboxypeptidase regulatory-like domain
MKSIRMVLVMLVAALLFAVGAPQLMAQTASTGALTGTVTDPSGGVIASATVTVTNLATGQTRKTTTNANGSYQISLLPPGSYSVHFEAAGFKSADVPLITINVTETPTLNRKLEIGTSTQQVTVEANTQTIQTQSVTNGTVVSGQEINSLPLVTRNYTQIVDLSPGVVANVANASSVGNGTQDISANGSKANQNNYSMDGASIVDYASGTAGQTGSYAGIGIPNPDAIAQFKVQTSQFDAGYGRDPGANVEVITKGGSNNFHGDVWEFNRNNFFNANDFFYKNSEGPGNNKPQILKQNTFGFTFGGPIKKNKIFFFGSYQGFRQINGIGTTGFASGYQSAVYLPFLNDYADYEAKNCQDLRCTDQPQLYKKFLGSVFGPNPSVTCPSPITGFTVPAGSNCNTGWATGVTVASDGSNITNTAVAVLQGKGPLSSGYNQGGYWLAAAPEGCTPVDPTQMSSGCKKAISLPTHANENQYMFNTDWVLSPKNTLSERYFYSSDPQAQSFLCLGACLPGSPEDVTYTSHDGTLRLTSTLTNNLLNEARFTFQRTTSNGQDPLNLQACDLPNGGSIIPLINNGAPCPAAPSPFKEFTVIPILSVGGLYSPYAGFAAGGNFAATETNIIDTWQFGDQISWNHGIHSIRFGFDGERVAYNNTIPASGRGWTIFNNFGDFLTSSSGEFQQDPTYSDGTPSTAPANPFSPTYGCGYGGFSACGGGIFTFAIKGLLAHYNRINSFDWFFQDNIKVSRKLTVNAGLRWEYDGFPDDKIGQFTNTDANLAAAVNTGSFYLNDAATNWCASNGLYGTPTGSLAGYLVPSNFDKTAGFTGPCGSTGVTVNSNKTLIPGTPLDLFQPRLGVAWQPLGDKFVVRAGYGWFYDRLYGSLLIDNQLNVPPYALIPSGAYPNTLLPTLHDPYAAVAGTPLGWQPRYIYVVGGGPNGTGGDPNVAGATIASSSLGYTSDSNQMAHRFPLTQEYSLDLQYEIAHSWVVDVGYVGSHSIHEFNWSQQINIAHLVDCGAPSATCNAPTEPQDKAMVVGAASPLQLPNANTTLSYLPFNDPANTTSPIIYNTTYNTAARVSYLGFSEGGLVTTNTVGDTTYNSLQMQLRHNFSHGVLFQASYTWSKELTNVDTTEAGNGIQEPGQVTNGASNSNNPLDLGQQYGPAAFNRSQRLIVSYSYTLPWKSTSGFSGKALSGWTVSGVTTVQNGEPFTITDATGGSIYGSGGTNRAMLADPVNCGSNGICQPGPKYSVSSSGSTTSRVISGMTNPSAGGWINPAAFTPFSTLNASSSYCIGGIPNPSGSSTATCGSSASPFVGAGWGFGNAPIGILTGPGQWNSDMSIEKDTKVTEGTTLQFRAEFYNLFNHPQFNPPASTAIGSTTFGLIQSSSVTPRVIQFGLKFLF